MEFKDFITRCDGSGSTNSAADLLLTTLRVTCGGRSYRIVEDEEGLPVQLLKYQETANKIEDIFRRVIAALFTIVLCIPVAIGACLKWKAFQDEQVRLNYQIYVDGLESNPKQKCVLIEGLAVKADWDVEDVEGKAEREIEDSQEKICARYDNILLNLVERGLVGSKTPIAKHDSRTEYDSLIEGYKKLWKFTQTDDWTDVPNPTAARKKLKAQLKTILYLAERAPLNSDLVEALHEVDTTQANRCAPTRIEAPSQTILKLLRGVRSSDHAATKNRLLDLIRKYKEYLIEQADNKSGGTQWHVLDYARKYFGDVFGLDDKNIRYDGYIGSREASDTDIKNAIYRGCTVKKLVDVLKTAYITEQDYNKEKPVIIHDKESLSDLRDYIFEIVKTKYQLETMSDVGTFIGARSWEPGDQDHDSSLDGEWIYKMIKLPFKYKDEIYNIDQEIPTDYAFELILEDLGIIG